MTQRSEARKKQIRRTKKSAASSTSASRRPQGRDPAASPEGKRRWLSQSQACNSGGESGVAGEVSLASTTSATSTGRGARMSTPCRQDKADRIDEEVLDESAAKEKPAKTTRGLRSSSRSSASGGDEGGSSSSRSISTSSSSEDGGPEEDGVLEETDKKKLLVL